MISDLLGVASESSLARPAKAVNQARRGRRRGRRAAGRAAALVACDGNTSAWLRRRRRRRRKRSQPRAALASRMFAGLVARCTHFSSPVVVVVVVVGWHINSPLNLASARARPNQHHCNSTKYTMNTNRWQSSASTVVVVVVIVVPSPLSIGSSGNIFRPPPLRAHSELLPAAHDEIEPLAGLQCRRTSAQ